MPAGKIKEKNMSKVFCIFKVTEERVRNGVGSGFISQSYGSQDPDPDWHQNVTDPQHCLKVPYTVITYLGIIGDVVMWRWCGRLRAEAQLPVGIELGRVLQLSLHQVAHVSVDLLDGRLQPARIEGEHR